MEVVRTAVNELFDKFGNVGTGGPFGRQLTDLLLAWNFSSEQEPEETCKGLTEAIAVF